jgi:hypothetical protein
VKKTVTIEMVSDFDDVLLARVLQAVGDLLRSGKPQGFGDRRANMMVHCDGSITTGVEERTSRALAGSWHIEFLAEHAPEVLPMLPTLPKVTP